MAQRVGKNRYLKNARILNTQFRAILREFLGANPRNREYVEKHAQILKSLAEGNALEDIEVSSLV